jgi:glycerate kinase
MTPAVVVCAPNAFKGTLTARVAAAAMARGVRDTGAVAVEIPVADGGDGTLDVLLAARGSGARVTRHRVTGPVGGTVIARLGWLSGDAAVIELAEASGLRRLRTASLDALHATSRGTGDLIRIAAESGAKSIVVGVGGSACTDGGAGLLQALGARLTDSSGAEIGSGGAGLADLAAVDLSPARHVLAGCSIEVACDIRGPLLGPTGAAQMFAPQKGASPQGVQRLELGLAKFATLAAASRGGDLSALPGAGAAGGCGFGLALLGARLVSGASLVCDLVDLDAALAGADAAITGEGRLDAQTAEGKAPAEVATRARRCGIPCIAIAGTVVDASPALFTSTMSLATLDPAVDSQRHPKLLLRRAAGLTVAGLTTKGTGPAKPY